MDSPKVLEKGECTLKYNKKEMLLILTHEEAMEQIREHEIKTNTSYSVYNGRRAGFGKADIMDRVNKLINFKVKWLGKVPFLVENDRIFECKHGPDRHLKEKMQHRYKRQQEKELVPTKKHRKPRDSIKMGCLASIKLLEISMFPDYAVPKNTKWRVVTASKRLRDDIKFNKGKGMKAVKRFILTLPSNEDHSMHPVGEEATEVRQSVDLRIWKKIEDLVAASVINPIDIRQQLKKYVANELYPNSPDYPAKTNKRYFPLVNAINKIVSEIIQKSSFTKAEEELLKSFREDHLSEHAGDLFYFQLYQEFPKQKLLIVYQSAHQRYLLQRYGNELCILEPAYRAIKYPFPLYFICVKTNVDYQIVAMFVTKDEKTGSIAEALQKLKDKNQSWRPEYFMTEFCEHEIDAIESVFPESVVLLCDSNRQDIWERWIKFINHVPKDHRANVLQKLRNIADATSFHSFKKAVSNLSESELWKSNEKLQNWFGNKWLPMHRRWAWFHRKDEVQLCMSSANKEEREMRHPSYDCLLNKTEVPLLTMMALIINTFLPESFKVYEHLNLYSVLSLDTTQVPEYLLNRPAPFILHCVECISAAATFDFLEVICLPRSCYSVHSHSDDNVFYKVNLGSDDIMPSCECYEWKRTKWPCKHFFAVFHLTDTSWDSLPSKYKNSRGLLIDTNAAIRSYETVPEDEDDTSDCNDGGDANMYLPESSPIDTSNTSSNNLNTTETQFICIVQPENSMGNLALEPLIINSNIVNTQGHDLNVGTQFALGHKCRELLTEIRSKTFDVSEPVLNELNKHLGQTLEWLTTKSNSVEKQPKSTTKPAKGKKRKVMFVENSEELKNIETDDLTPKNKKSANSNVVQVPVEEINDMNIVLEGPFQDMEYVILLDDD